MIKRSSHLQFTEHSVSFFRLVDVVVISVALLLVMSWYQVLFSKDYLLLLIVSLVIFSYVAQSVQLYQSIQLNLFTQQFLLLFAVLSLTSLFVTLILFLTKEGGFYSRVVLAFWYVASLFGLMGWRLIYRKLKRQSYLQGKQLRKIAIIGLTPTGLKLFNEIESHPELGFKCIGFFDDREPSRLEGDTSQLMGSVSQAIEMARRYEIEAVYICLPLQAEQRIAEMIHALGDTTTDVYMVPNFLLNNLMHGNVGRVGALDTISVFESPISGMKDFYKRTFDIVFSSCALIGLSPILLGIAIAIKWNSKGPVLFRQDRYGLDGKRIGVYKFRSMSVMDNDAVVKQATKNDSRITKVGGFLRKASLDELPQFFNVLMGDMSVVGPRPHAVAHNEEYRKRVDYYMLRHKVRPGITGWAQINGWRGETDTLEKMEKRVEYDLDYIRHWSIWFDIKIIFWTFFKGFVNKNAY
ncbi:Capsular polysaccharide synthesis enzyme CpsA, sugar transferase [hydrothermal vent metagenome]|uniref:Capsular polysaccharide synthesis enzyme CpsA, sugar transferase n=1 Tax=hydrothermal vent metagenome TaxID=652676 RepID=A0A3B0WRM1_9ZZZZ